MKLRKALQKRRHTLRFQATLLQTIENKKHGIAARGNLLGHCCLCDLCPADASQVCPEDSAWKSARFRQAPCNRVCQSGLADSRSAKKSDKPRRTGRANELTQSLIPAYHLV